MNRKILIILIVVVLIVLAGIISYSQLYVKSDTQINFLSNSSLKNGDSVQFELIDAQGNHLVNQEISISFETPNGTESYSVVTNDAGKGSLLLNDEDSGVYNITVSYAGDKDHNNCSARQSITIGDPTQQNANSTSNYDSSASNYQSGDSSYATTSSASSSGVSYDSDLNVQYDSNGKVVGGQNDGADYNYVKNNPQRVVDGNLE